MTTALRQIQPRPVPNISPATRRHAHGIPSEQPDTRLDDTNTRLDDTNTRLDDTNREMIHNSPGLHDESRNTNGRLDGWDNMIAKMRNEGATHINSPIRPVGHDDGTPIPTELSDQYKQVHRFVRLERRRNWPILARLLRFYGSESWPTWGLIKISFGDGIEVEEPLEVHETLEMAIAWAPEIALQELAWHIGLDYGRIMTNIKMYDRRGNRRADYTKRVMVDESAASRREGLETPERQRAHIPQADMTKEPTSTDALSRELGWDSRVIEDRTPEPGRPHARDPPSASTADAVLPVSGDL